METGQGERDLKKETLTMIETGQREGEVKNTAEQGWRPAREQEVKKEVEFQNLLVMELNERWTFSSSGGKTLGIALGLSKVDSCEGWVEMLGS
ncbi:hypothetical protein Scep_024413 [Stephania cephalantha]|uniref:Uncharacterized protein n=1 Tax=Stephania cephalantha TaxID=152367 RepID=A0AAP0F1Z2_9MAGN